MISAKSLALMLIVAMMTVFLLVVKKSNKPGPGKWWNAWYEDGVFDYKGRPMARVINYKEFLSTYAPLVTTAHDFRKFGFLYDEGGVYGFENCAVGFKSRDDERAYQMHCKNSGVKFVG